jgi:nucleotide-binding universal stress UspA family protein
MADNVLVPVDDSEYARKACQLVVEEFSEADIVLLHAVNPAEGASYSPEASLPSFSNDWYDRERERAQDLFDEIESDVLDAETVVRRTIEVGSPTNVVVEYVEDEDNAVDHIVMGSHGRQGVSRVLLGSVAERVLRRSPVPVTVVR